MVYERICFASSAVKKQSKVKPCRKHEKSAKLSAVSNYVVSLFRLPMLGLVRYSIKAPEDEERKENSKDPLSPQTT